MEILSQDDLEKYASNFDKIKVCFDEKFQEKLLSHFQESLRKHFNLGDSPDTLTVSRAKLQMWKSNWQILQKHLEVSSSSSVSIIDEILHSILSISEQILKSSEKDQIINSTLKTELSLKHEENSTFYLTIENLESQIKRLNVEKDKLLKDLQKTQDELANSLELLQKENKNFLHKIIALSKQTADFSVSHSPVKTFRKEITPKIPNNTILMNNRIAQGRELGYKQLKETIEEVYATKVKYDEKCRDSKAAIETMDQFMFTYLNQKFGLKTIITEWTFAIMKAVSRYENEDAEVRLFSKIIKHQVNEDFRNVLQKVKEKIKSLLKTCLSNNTPFTRESQVSNLLKEKLQGKLEEKEWTGVIVLLYSPEESEYMIKQIQDIQSSKVQNKNPDEISYAEFQNIILAYDLNSHEILLEPFCQVYRKADSDNDGIVNREQAMSLCEVLKVVDVEATIQKMDPYGTDKITFSTCVQVFNEEKVQDSKENFSAIHRLFFSKHRENS